MTLQKALSLADLVRPNPFDEETKTGWICEVEGHIGSEILGLSPDAIPVYSYANDADKTLMVTPPHDKIYYLYLCAAIDAALGEIDRYANSMALYNSAESEFAKWYVRRHRADGTWNRGRGLTAYQVAGALGIRENDEGFLRAMAEGVVGCRAATEEANRLSISASAVEDGVKISVTNREGNTTETILYSNSTPNLAGSNGSAGIVSVKSESGLSVSGGSLSLDPATADEIAMRENAAFSKMPVTMGNLDMAVRAVVPRSVAFSDGETIHGEAGVLYYSGVCSDLTLSFPQQGVLGKNMEIRFYSGDTPTELRTEDGYTAEFSFVPESNAYCIIRAVWDPIPTETSPWGRWIVTGENIPVGEIPY